MSSVQKIEIVLLLTNRICQVSNRLSVRLLGLFKLLASIFLSCNLLIKVADLLIDLLLQIIECTLDIVRTSCQPLHKPLIDLVAKLNHDCRLPGGTTAKCTNGRTFQEGYCAMHVRSTRSDTLNQTT